MMANKADEREGRFWVAVAAVIEHQKSGEILILKKPDDCEILPGAWELSAGLLSQFEEPDAGLLREAKEETGLDVEIVRPLRAFHFYRGKKKAETEMVGFTYWCKTKSKSVRLSREHSDFRWINPKAAKKFVKHPGVLKDIAAFLKEKSRQ